MTVEATLKDSPATDFLAAAPRDDVPALRSLRTAGADHFDRVGLPHARDESWRFTSLRAFKATAYAAPEGAAPDIPHHDLAALSVPAVAGHTLVFVDGRAAPTLGTSDGDRKGLTVRPLLDATRDGDARALDHLGRQVAADADAFAALNAALFQDGAFIHVARETTVAEPIVILHVSTADQQPWMAHPRHLIVCEEASQLTVIEHHVSLTGKACMTNVVTEIAAAANATVNHYRIEEESDAAFHVATLGVHQAAGSKVMSHCVLFGGATVRNNVYPVLDGKGSHCLLNGLYVGNERQHFDNHMRVEHVKPGCESRQFYKGVLDGHAGGVFCGLIHVTQEAQQTDAKQSNSSLLLSPDATNHSRPQLEIYADDVKCTHGATVGQIDEDAIFYLRARGIPPASARAMMVYAHAAECFERMDVEPLREMLKRRLLQKMPWSHATG